MKTNPLSVKSKSGLIFPALVSIVMSFAIFSCLKSCSREVEHHELAVAAQAQEDSSSSKQGSH